MNNLETNNNNTNTDTNTNTDANNTNSTYPIPPLPSSSFYLYTSQDLPLFQILLEYSKTLSYSAFKLHLYYITKLLQSKKPINSLDIQDFCKEVNMENEEASLALKELQDKDIFPNDINWDYNFK